MGGHHRRPLGRGDRPGVRAEQRNGKAIGQGAKELERPEDVEQLKVVEEDNCDSAGRALLAHLGVTGLI